MRRNKTIRIFIAFWLLLVFSISVMPQSFFHDLLAGHRDSPACHEPQTKERHFHQRTFECHFNNLVVTLPYFGVAPFIAAAPAIPYLRHEAECLTGRLLQGTVTHDTRGPPVI